MRVTSRHRRIGLLGGSFNPAHRGHLHLSLTALKCLDLDEVWWLVSPQNPLKPVAGMAPFADRLEQARQIAAGHNRIRVTDLENRLGGSHYTADTLRILRRRFPRLRFVWLMGGDNLAQIPHWERWTEIFRTVPIAVFDRPSYSLKALAGRAAQAFRPAPPDGRRRAPAGRDKTAGLGVFPYPARPEFGDPDPGRAQQMSSPNLSGARHPNWPRSPR